MVKYKKSAPKALTDKGRLPKGQNEHLKCKKSAPKALTDKGELQKGQNEHLKNGPKRYVYQ